MADEQQQEQWPHHRRRSRHHCDDRCTPAQGQQGQRQTEAPEVRRENTAGRAASLCIADNAPCPVHPGAGHTWGECRENARNCANNNNQNNAQGSGGGQCHG